MLWVSIFYYYYYLQENVQFKHIFKIILISFSKGSAHAWTCPSQSGFFRNPTNAHKFYECVNGHEYEYTCPSDLVFNESISLCDYTIGPEVHVTTQEPATVTPVPLFEEEATTQGRHHE